MTGNFRASDEEESWNHELNTHWQRMVKNWMWCFDEVGLCIDCEQEINEVIRLGNALGKATEPAGLCMLIHPGEYLEQEDWCEAVKLTEYSYTGW